MKSTPSMSAKKPLPLLSLDQKMSLYNKPQMIGKNLNQFKEIEQQLIGDK